MRSLVKIVVPLTVAASLAATSTAFAEVNPNSTFAQPAGPLGSLHYCIGPLCPIPHQDRVATDPTDCNRAGLGLPHRDTVPWVLPGTGGDGSSYYFEYPEYDDPNPWSIWPGTRTPITNPSHGFFIPKKGTFFDAGYRGFRSVNIEESSPLSVDAFLQETPQRELRRRLNQRFSIGGTTWSSYLFEQQYYGDVILDLNAAGVFYELNPCRRPQAPNDPNYRRTGRHGGNSWGIELDDQWAIKRVGFTDDESSAWNKVPDDASPVVVAVIDSGLDWHHPDINAANIWRNENEVPDNGVDDDKNGYVDDIIGWDFLARNNTPWDFDGHGTVVAGVIAAEQNNGKGIAGIDPNVRIMVLKAINNLGNSRASFIAEAIVYAVDNGARVINISIGGPSTSRMEQAAINYAHENGVLVIAAAGNEGIELADYGPGGSDNVLTVGATHDDNRATAFSNFGPRVDIVAPGVDVLSLRARGTDANYRPEVPGNEIYTAGESYVGDDKAYLHVNGTSFSAPIVAATASLLLSKNPELTADEVRDILLQTASDVDLPGPDKYTGAGMVDARMALDVEPGFSVTAEISKIEIVPADAPQFIRVHGTVDASVFKRAWMQIGPGENPGAWRYVGPKRKFAVRDGELATIPYNNFTSDGVWQIVINVEHKNGVVKSAAYPVTIQ